MQGSRSYRETNMTASCQKGGSEVIIRFPSAENKWSRSYKEINHNPNLEWNFISREFQAPFRISWWMVGGLGIASQRVTHFSRLFAIFCRWTHLLLRAIFKANSFFPLWGKAPARCSFSTKTRSSKDPERGDLGRKLRGEGWGGQGEKGKRMRKKKLVNYHFQPRNVRATLVATPFL